MLTPDEEIKLIENFHRDVSEKAVRPDLAYIEQFLSEFYLIPQEKKPEAKEFLIRYVKESYAQ